MKKEAVIVVFGCRYQEELLARVNAARHFVMRNSINPIFIFAGNDSPPLDVFKADRIIWENKSTTTEENVNNVLEIIKKYWIDKNRVWVSSWYHIPKIKLFLRKAGINVKRETFVKSHSGIALTNILVEPFAFLAAFFKFNHRPFIKKIKRSFGYI